jgi:uncharacterized protein (TIRG00374 family)
MRSHIRTAVVLALAVVLLALFLRNVDISGVVNEIVHAQPGWLALSLASMFLNLAIRSYRWQYLLEPLGSANFGDSFRATAVGFAARSILPAAAGELVRPYFLSRHVAMSATGAFATIVIERLLDMVTILILLASYVFVFGSQLGDASSPILTAVKWAGVTAGALSIAALVVLFVLAGHPARIREFFARLERVMPSSLAGVVARVAEKFAIGLSAIRSPERLLATLGWSFPLWLSIALGIWAAAEAFRLNVPFTGSFLLIALLTVGVTIPTPGAVGGFHEAFRVGATTFFDAPNAAAVGAAIVLHAMSIGPALLLGLFFAAQEGLNLTGLRRLADQAESGKSSIGS